MVGGVSRGKADHWGSPRRTEARVSVTSSPGQALLPVRHSKSTQPKDQMSQRWSTGLPRACSGLIYAAVPRIVPGRVVLSVMVGESARLAETPVPDPVGGKVLARPKSRTLT